MMAENPTTSIDIDTERQDDKSALGSLRSNVFTAQKKPSQFNHHTTQLLYRSNPIQIIQKKSLKKRFPKLIKSFNILRQKISQMIILTPKRKIKFQL